jgi:hypothetical protein
MNRKYIISVLAAVFFLNISLFAQYIKVEKDDKGWRLLDGTTPVEVKGVVWSYTPVGESYSYDLWSHDDAYIKLMIDTDMPLLKAMGVNTIRCFSTIPPKWVEYIYSKYGIYTIINDLLGRYGVTVNGTWYPSTDYSDTYTRETLIAEARKTAETYRAVDGVLMYMFGNESNYGLVWSGTNIENLPAGEQSTVKAGYLYSLLEEAMSACKDIDPFHPVGIVNGDTQYLDLIKKLCPSLDVLGVNAYRGYRFYDSFYENVADTLDKPVMFTESGADAFNEISRQEDQNAQMVYLKSQWQEIYQQSYGKGRSQNVIGGFVFEWVDEWWKHYQTKDLAVHNTEGTWSNSGYELDYRDGLNNMDEEWFGLCAQSKLTDRGINKRIPRAAYYMLSDAWKLSLYDSTDADITRTFGSLNTALYLAVGNERSVKETLNEHSLVKIGTLDTTVQTTTPCYVNDLKGSDWKSAFRYKNSDGAVNEPTTSAESSLGVTVQPFEKFHGVGGSKGVDERAVYESRRRMVVLLYGYRDGSLGSEHDASSTSTCIPRRLITILPISVSKGITTSDTEILKQPAMFLILLKRPSILSDTTRTVPKRRSRWNLTGKTYCPVSRSSADRKCGAVQNRRFLQIITGRSLQNR